MAGGLVALLDDVAALAKLAAASVDDVGAAAGRASVKAAGVVVDDTAVTPRYVQGLTPDRELPIIKRIARRLAAQQAARSSSRPRCCSASSCRGCSPRSSCSAAPTSATRAPRRSGRSSAGHEDARGRRSRRSTTTTRRPMVDRRHPHRLHPVRRDHGHRPQRGRRRAVRVAGDHPRRRRGRSSPCSSTAWSG